MASAVLVNRKDADWPPQHRGGAAGAGFMGKVPFANPNPNPKPNLTKSVKRSSQFQYHAPSSVGGGHYNNGYQIDVSPAVTQTASDDASSINHHRRSGGGGELGLGNSQYVSFSLRSYSRKELSDLKTRLVSELDRIRQLQRRIEAGELNHQQHHNQAQPPQIKKSAPSKKQSGSKRPFPVNPNHQQKDSAPNPKRSQIENPLLMKNCAQVLTKLMKHKSAWVFNKPVDVIGMGLHDYYDIIKRPMDLGTVKTNLSKNLYSSVSDVASDVRLTFQNAMAYNPKGHEVHTMAELLLSKFEELFGPLGEKLTAERAYDLQASSWDHVEPERPVKKREEKRPEPAMRAAPPPPPPPPPVVHAPVIVPTPVVNSPPMTAQSPVRTPSPPMRALPVKSLKLPKPKAKDPNKREMNMEEKHKLGVGLQSLPQEKMEQVVQIIRKRNGHLKQDGDEIELDIEAVDTETLWELDRLVTNFKKMVSKVKRQALMTNLNHNNVTPLSKGNAKEFPASEKMDSMATPSEPKRPKKGEPGDEDVDIGDDLPMSSFPPVEIEKDDRDVGVGGSGVGGIAVGGGGGGGHASSSSSSGSSSSSSGSSSSSDSDSGSSSGSDSDDDNAHS